MVYKVTKGGVRSGNTLRGLRSHSTRWYTQSGCIVGRSNLKPIDVPTFLDSHIEDKLISSSLGSTDVALSLNKKKRWLLPATVGHMIKTGSFNDEKTMVSLLERHKLKRRANCVSFVCNQGRVRYSDSRQKRYFTFSIDNIDNTLSNKHIKRRKEEIMEARRIKETNPIQVQITNDFRHGPMKTAEVFTASGADKDLHLEQSFVSSQPEYRLEVLYPCPQTCSLRYNPKHTNLHMEFGKEGEIELKSDLKVMKKGRRQRKRFTFKDLETYESEIVTSDISEFRKHNYEEDGNESVSDAESTASYQDDDDKLKTKFDYLHKNVNEKNSDDEVSQTRDNENIIAQLIAQAEKARVICDSVKLRACKTQTGEQLDDHFFRSHVQEKSHIVYVNNVSRRFRSKKKHRSTGLFNESAGKTLKKQLPTSTTTKYLSLHSARVIIQSTDVSPETLRVKFGRFYAESESDPRRFVIDVTEDVQNLVCPYRDAELSAMFTSFLVFVHDGLYDEGLDTFRVIFNSNCCPETEAFKNNIPFGETSIAEVMNRIASTILDMRKDNLLDLSYDKSCGSTNVPMLKFVHDVFKTNIKTFLACDEIRRISHTDVMQESSDFSAKLDRVARNIDLDIFCDICYENINPTQTWDVCGTKLSKCSHIFCDDCWRSHLRTKLRDGAVKMTCPGYDCDETVGPVTMLSLLHVSEVSKFFQRKCEEDADSSSNSRWCPNRACGRVIKLDVEKSTNDMSLDVTCSCGEEFCFSCLSHPHWPATCDQAEKYEEKLQTVGHTMTPMDDSGGPSTVFLQSRSRHEVEYVEVNGRLCPKCHKFIEKRGGCPHIDCKCGYQFCWECLKDWNVRHWCIPNATTVFEHTLKLKIRHTLTPKIVSLSSQVLKKNKNTGSRQKTQMCKKALQERQEVQNFKFKTRINEMAKQITHASQKNLRLKTEILSICGIEFDDKDTDELFHYPLVSHVSKFLRSCCEIKRALHHVAEFTFVLLQDTADSVDKRRALRLANDLSGYCSFIRSILETGQRQDMGAAVKRLVDIQTWARRALTVLLATVNNLKC